jgi:hypothetical protein
VTFEGSMPGDGAPTSSMAAGRRPPPLLAEYQQLEKELTPSEKSIIQEGYAALAVGPNDGE